MVLTVTTMFQKVVVSDDMTNFKKMFVLVQKLLIGYKYL